MPNAQAYRDAAGRYRSLGEQLAREAGVHRTASVGAFVSGPVATSIEGSLAATGTHLARAADAIAQLARTCDERAEVCAAYAREVQRYWQLPWVDRRYATPYPMPPAPWVEL